MEQSYSLEKNYGHNSPSPLISEVTVTDMIDERALAYPEKIAFNYLPSLPSLGGETVTYLELQRRSQRLAAQILRTAVPGDRALLVYECNLDYVVSFFACLYAGVVAVPVYPPVAPQHVARLKAIIEDCSPTITLTTAALRGLCPLRIPSLVTDLELPSTVEVTYLPLITPEALAFLQYTSGSTGQPKGVMLTHENLMSNLRMIRHGFQLRHDDVQLSWLPLYHDMGLIGGVMSSIAIGAMTYLVPPMTIVRPFKWLKAVSDLRVTVTGAPNFVFDLCCEKIPPEKVSDLNLSSLRMLFTGAEPVRQPSMDRFTLKFSLARLNASVITPCYGMAEATLMVSSTTPGAGVHVRTLPGEAPYVSCGKVVPGLTVKIIDESGSELPENSIGEILLTGPSIARGYWNRSEASSETFVQRDGRLFLRTGDMGFLDAKANLYITGRIKELVIVRGKKYFPSDIEDVARLAHPAGSLAVMAAFGHEVDGEERLVVALEASVGATESEIQELRQKITQAVQSEFSLTPQEIVVVRKGEIPRTSSGKVRRNHCRALHRTQVWELFRDDWRNTSLFNLSSKKLRKARLIADYQFKNLASEALSTFPLLKRGIESITKSR